MYRNRTQNPVPLSQNCSSSTSLVYIGHLIAPPRACVWECKIAFCPYFIPIWLRFHHMVFAITFMPQRTTAITTLLSLETVLAPNMWPRTSLTSCSLQVRRNLCSNCTYSGPEGVRAMDNCQAPNAVEFRITCIHVCLTLTNSPPYAVTQRVVADAQKRHEAEVKRGS